MLNAGLRCNEAIKLKVKDPEPYSGQSKVLGKGDKGRVVWLGKADVKLILADMEARRGKVPRKAYLSQSARGAGKQPVRSQDGGRRYPRCGN